MQCCLPRCTLQNSRGNGWILAPIKQYCFVSVTTIVHILISTHMICLYAIALNIQTIIHITSHKQVNSRLLWFYAQETHAVYKETKCGMIRTAGCFFYETRPPLSQLWQHVHSTQMPQETIAHHRIYSTPRARCSIVCPGASFEIHVGAVGCLQLPNNIVFHVNNHSFVNIAVYSHWHSHNIRVAQQLQTSSHDNSSKTRTIKVTGFCSPSNTHSP